ncbi:hypothetical protein D1841_16855, partial [Neglecta sp. X4]|uniref:hypothetical protein n=1 Tax=unclassified Neglectibacter TaxID=2632164 RepID=UPI00136C1A82
MLVTAADGKTQKYYTLTVTKADATELQPTITAAKLVLNKGKDDEYVSNGVVDTAARTITFTVPHSTLDTAVQPSTVDPIFPARLSFWRTGGMRPAITLHTWRERA